MVPPELSGVLEVFTPQAADSGRQRRLRFLEDLTETTPVLSRSRQDPAREQLVRFYTEGAPGFARWSPEKHQHFGYLGRFADFFDRKAMLGEMTRQVISRLQLDPTQPATLLDAGCGAGASAVQTALQYPRFAIDGISLAPQEVERASELACRSGMVRRLRFWVDDFTASCGDSASYDGLYAIESACHDRGLAKEGFVREAGRLLKGGRRLVIADGFYKGPPSRRGFSGRIAAALERHWGLDTFGEIGAFVLALRTHGFTDIKAEEVSGRVAASALHGPFLAARWLLESLSGSRPLGAVAASQLKAGLLAPLLGLAPGRFGYFLVSARRRRV